MRCGQQRGFATWPKVEPCCHCSHILHLAWCALRNNRLCQRLTNDSSDVEGHFMLHVRATSWNTAWALLGASIASWCHGKSYTELYCFQAESTRINKDKNQGNEGAASWKGKRILDCSSEGQKSRCSWHVSDQQYCSTSWIRNQI